MYQVGGQLCAVVRFYLSRHIKAAFACTCVRGGRDTATQSIRHRGTFSLGNFFLGGLIVSGGHFVLSRFCPFFLSGAFDLEPLIQCISMLNIL